MKRKEIIKVSKLDQFRLRHICMISKLAQLFRLRSICMNKKLKEKIKAEIVDFVVRYAKTMGVILGVIGVLITIMLLGCGPLLLILKAKVLALRIIGGILVVPCIALLITILSTISGDSDDY